MEVLELAKSSMYLSNSDTLVLKNHAANKIVACAKSLIDKKVLFVNN